MTVHELIQHLQNFPAGARVIMWDCDGGADFPCVGSIYDHQHQTVELTTDLGESGE